MSNVQPKGVRRSVLVSAAATVAAAVLPTSPVYAAPIEWRDMSNTTIPQPFDPPAPWFNSTAWDPMTIPTLADDVSFGRPFALPAGQTTYVALIGNAETSAFAGSLTLDGALLTGAGTDFNALNFTVSDGNFGGFIRTLQIANAFEFGTRSRSRVSVFSDNGRVTQTNSASINAIGRDGADGSLSISGRFNNDTNSLSPDLSVAGILRVGRGYDLLNFNASLGELQLSEGAIGTLGGALQVGTRGGNGLVFIQSQAQLTVNNAVIIGAGSTPFPGGGFAVGSGSLAIQREFTDPKPSRLDIVGNRLDVGIEIAGAGVANGLVNVFRSVLNIEADASGASIVAGRGVVSDGSSVIRSNGDIGIGGRNFGPTEEPGLKTAGNVFLGLDGGSGTLISDAALIDLGDDLVVADGGGTTPDFGYQPSLGTVDVGLNSRFIVRDDVFIGNNKSIGVFNANASGDGGSISTADYVSVGHLGKGTLNVGGMNTVQVREIEMKLASGSNEYEEGGFVTLGVSGGASSALLSTVDFHANGEGNRFEWASGVLEIRNGRLYNWGGSNALTVPADGTLRAAGRVETDVVAEGIIDVGYQDLSFTPVFPAQLIITGDLDTLATARVQFDIRNPTRLAGGLFDTLEIQGDATFAGTLDVFFNPDNSVLPYPWAPFDPTTILPGDTFDLFDYTGPVTGTFSFLNLPDLAFPYTWQTDRLYTTGEIYIGVIPEPASLAVVLGSAGLLLSRRRRLR